MEETRRTRTKARKKQGRRMDLLMDYNVLTDEWGKEDGKRRMWFGTA